ncbi:MAG: glycoside hydrolase family 55 protein [Kiritimatiellae bacterium]|nr:glycoside hydrolase family 55 protein [Kiritimatiellia bacterium]
MKRSKLRWMAFAGALIVLLAAWGEAGPIDVLSLGVKNDGSADVSAIVNANTAKGALYFPAGRYRVSHPLILKNPIRGAGYARIPGKDASRTWLVSDMATNNLAGVVQLSDRVRVNVENLNIICASGECAIRIEPCTQGTMTFIDKVGLFNVESYGLYIQGRGSRPIFAQNMTIFSSWAHPEKSVAVRVYGASDCRFSNIEMMGVCVGMEVHNGHTYCNNLHLWTGVQAHQAKPFYWKNTRGIVLGAGANFAGSDIYPDTAYYPIYQCAEGAICEIANVMCWEDGTVKNVKERTGRFYYRDPASSGKLILKGGLIGAGGNDASPGCTRPYIRGEEVTGVMLKSDYALTPTNLDWLCVGTALPDYRVRYAEKGYCKVADIFTVAKTGACQCHVACDDGATWRVDVVRGRDGKTVPAVTPLNALCAVRELKVHVEGDHVKVFVRSEGTAPWTARVTTTFMGDDFRPLDHGSLRTKNGRSRFHEVLPLS